MRHGKSGRHLTRTSAHHLAMRRNLAQSLFQHGEIRTTLEKAKEVRSFCEKLITLARKGDLRSRQRVIATLNDRAIITEDNQEAYDGMTDAQRHKVLTARTGRRHRAGVVPASYNKNKISFVASGVVHRLFSEVAPRYKDRAGGYTRIIRLSDRRIGDNSTLAILQLVGTEEAGSGGDRKGYSRRREMARNRMLALEGKSRPAKRKPGKSSGKPAAESKPAADAESGKGEKD